MEKENNSTNIQAAQEPKKPKKPKKPRKPWTKKRIILWVAVGLVILFFGYSCFAAPIMAVNAARTQVDSTMGVTALCRQDIASTISATGVVESADKHYVYPAMTGYTVMEVPVEVGDVVQAGDVLCRLDDGAIQNQIESNELSLTQQVKAAEQQVKTVKDSYQAAMDAVEHGTNATLISAESQVTSAYNSYLSAIDSYNNYLDSADKADSAVAAAKAALAKARQDLAAAQAATPTNVENVTKAAQAVTAAEAALQSAETAQSSASGQGSNLYRAVGTAYNNYVTALRSMEAAIDSVDTQLQSSKNQLTSSQISAETARLTKDLTLAQLEESLDDTVVAAPASGTVTAVYATVGASGAGLLFTIEDVDNLVVKTSVKSLDVGTVKEGMEVAIRSDATGDAVYTGTIISIAPAAQKTAAGETDTANESFAVEVAVNSRDTDLRIGMSTRLNYLVDQQEGVLTVPYDAVYTNGAGQDCVLAAVQQSDGRYLLSEVPVTLGIESDIEVAVSGEGLSEGMLVLNDPASHAAGELITLV